MIKKSVKNYISRSGVKKDHVNLGGEPSYNSCFNAVKMKNGKWEVFYGQYGIKDHRTVHKKEEDAYDALARLIDIIRDERSDKFSSERHYRDRMIPLQFAGVIVIYAIAILMALFFVIYTLVTRSPIDWIFWFWIGWIAVYTFLIICWFNKDLYAKMEYYATPVIFGLVSLAFIGVMLVGFAYLLPLIFSGQDVGGNIFSLVMTELSFGTYVVIFYHFYLKKYIYSFIIYLRKKKHGEEESPFIEIEDIS